MIERYILSGNSIALPDGVMDDGPTTLVGHGRGAITALTACDRLLYSAANDMTFRMWDCRACVQLAVLASGVEAPCALSVSGESGLLLSASNAGAGQISVWRLPASGRFVWPSFDLPVRPRLTWTSLTKMCRWTLV